MENPAKNGIAGRPRPTAANQRTNFLTPEHCLRLIFHRKWLILGVFVLVSAVTVGITTHLPNVYSSDTLILVDPQKVPDNYVKATVSGDIRNRLGTLKQQILSATRLQKIIDNLNLYPVERKTMAREDVITRMRSDIAVSVVSDFGGSQDLQAFKIEYSGGDPQLVSQVTNELASLFIEENLKAREQQAEGTSEFLTNQLEETRKTLEDQEAKLKDFRLKHIGEMPEQQNADLQILGQLQSQLQLEGDALNRAEQQKNYTESMMASSQSAGVVDLDDPTPTTKPGGAAGQVLANTATAKERQLAALRAHGYTEIHPDVRRLKQEIEQETKNAKEPESASTPAAAPEAAQISAPSPPAPARQPVAPPKYVNPILQTQLNAAESEIAKHKEQVQILSKQVAAYQAKLEKIPVNEQEITGLVRDYEISKAHYGQLLNNELSAATATQLEVRQKGEKFSILDPAQPAQKPTKPNRLLLNLGGSLGGLALGLFLALATEFVGMSITSAEHMVAVSGLPVLEVIPSIETRIDRLSRRRRIFMATASSAVAALAAGAFLAYHYGPRFF
jgi:polysaccharide chain length determinant protein (PEP-CTERM system associated)